MKHADPVHRVTIIPRSIGALGATLQLPTEERYLMTREELVDRLCVLLGGRVAEELACADVSTGAEDDLERASEIARQMVCRFGMSDVLGPMTFGRPGARFLNTGDAPEKNYADETACVIDAEVHGLIEREHARARSILGERHDALHAIAGELLVHETLQRAEIEALAKVGAKRPVI
jgi:cell division protease FtsH